MLANIYLPNIGSLKYIKKISRGLKEETDINTVRVEDFITSYILMGKFCRKKIYNKILALNNTLHQMNLAHIY